PTVHAAKNPAIAFRPAVEFRRSPARGGRTAENRLAMPAKLPLLAQHYERPTYIKTTGWSARYDRQWMCRGSGRPKSAPRAACADGSPDGYRPRLRDHGRSAE